MKCSNNYNDSNYPSNIIDKVVNIPYPLYLSLQGKYFVGNADELNFGNYTGAWAGLINPKCSGVNLHVYVWTATNIGTSPIEAQIWFNSIAPGCPTPSELITPSNTALCPLPEPRTVLLKANDVVGEPYGGVKAFSRIVPPDVTIADEEDGKFIFPPGGSFIVFLSNPEAPNESVKGKVAFGWYEEKIR